MNDKLKLRVTGYGLRVTITLLLTLSFFFIPSLIQYDKHSSAGNLIGISYAYAEGEESTRLEEYEEGASTGSEEARILPRCGPAGSTETGSEKYDLNSFLWLLILILRWIFSITGSLAVLMFVYGGYLWLMSAGEEKRVKEGTSTMVNAVIGVAIILGSWLGVNVIVAAMTGAPGNIGTGSIAWNSIGAHCKGRTTPLDFFKKTPPPPEPPAVAGGAGTPPRPGTTTPPPAPGTTTPPPSKKCNEPGGPTCPDPNKPCNPTTGKCEPLKDCNPACNVATHVCNKTTGQCEPKQSQTGACCLKIQKDHKGGLLCSHIDYDYKIHPMIPSTDNGCSIATVESLGIQGDLCIPVGNPFANAYTDPKIVQRKFCSGASSCSGCLQ